MLLSDSSLARQRNSPVDVLVVVAYLLFLLVGHTFATNSARERFNPFLSPLFPSLLLAFSWSPPPPSPQHSPYFLIQHIFLLLLLTLHEHPDKREQISSLRSRMCAGLYSMHQPARGVLHLHRPEKTTPTTTTRKKANLAHRERERKERECCHLRKP